MPEDFDFDAWAALAARDPAAFEAARGQALESLISRDGEEERLRRLQWRVDAERRRARTPLKACLVLSGMMWTAFFDFRDALNNAMGTPEIGRPKLHAVSDSVSLPPGRAPAPEASSLASPLRHAPP